MSELRKFYHHTTGQQESAEIQKRRLLYEKKMESELKRHPNLEKFLQSVNFDLLADIIKPLLERSQKNPESLNLLPSERIYSTPSGPSNNQYTGEYNAKKNIIQLNYEKIKKLCEQVGMPIDLMLTYTLIHEEIHAVSYTECHETEVEKESMEYTQQSGYQTTEKNAQGEHISFYAFDEGVNEKIAQRVAREYVLRATDITEQQLNEFEQTYKTINLYTTVVAIIDGMMSRLASHTGVSEEVIFQAFTRGKFEPNVFSDPSVQEELAIAFSPHFVNGLKELTPMEAMGKLMMTVARDFSQTTSMRDPQVIQTFLEKLGN